jgi:hypothetical protein
MASSRGDPPVEMDTGAAAALPGVNHRNPAPATSSEAAIADDRNLVEPERDERGFTVPPGGSGD